MLEIHGQIMLPFKRYLNFLNVLFGLGNVSLDFLYYIFSFYIFLKGGQVVGVYLYRWFSEL